MNFQLTWIEITAGGLDAVGLAAEMLLVGRQDATASVAGNLTDLLGQFQSAQRITYVIAQAAKVSQARGDEQ